MMIGEDFGGPFGGGYETLDGAMDPFGADAALLQMPGDISIDDDGGFLFGAPTAASDASAVIPASLSPSSADGSPLQPPPSPPQPQQKPQKKPAKKRRCRDEAAATTTTTTTAAAEAPGVGLTGEERPSQLPRAVVAKLTSPDVQRYMADASARRVLSEEEQLQLKKLRRLVKNRESAQLSRQRKRDYVGKLEGIIHEMGATEAALRAENSALRDYASALQDKLAAAGVPFPPMPAAMAPQTSISVESPPTQLQEQQAPQQQQQQQLQRVSSVLPATPSRPLKAAGVCFLVVLFSVGLFFNATQQRVQHIAEPFGAQQQQTPQAGRLLAERSTATGHATTTPSRELMGIVEDDVASVVAPQTPLEEASAAAIAPAVVAVSDDDDDDDDISAALVSRSHPPSTTAEPLLLLKQPATLSPVWSPKNVTYLFCNDVKRYDPPELDGSGLLSFMLPLSTLNDSRGRHVVTAENDDLVEVTCSVVDVSIVPSRTSR